MPSKQPAKENTTTSNGAVTRKLRPRNNNTNAAKEKPTARIDRDLQLSNLSNNNGRTRSRRSRRSTSSCSIAKPPPAKKKKEDGMLQLPEDQATVSFPLGPERKDWNVVVPKLHVTAWQSITDNSSRPWQTLNCLATKSHRILNGGSPPQILYDWFLDPTILSVALLHKTSLRRSKTDYGLAVQFLPTLLRTLPLFQTAHWRKASDGEVCAEWNKMANKFDIDITTGGRGRGAAVVVDYDEVAFIYRSKNFVDDNVDAVAAMVGNNDNRAAFGRPPCKHGGCTKESVTRGFCKKHLPKICPFCEKNKAGKNANFECTSCYYRRQGKTSGGKLLLAKK